MSDYDSPWKEALDEFFPAFLAFFFPEAHAGIDWSRGYESLDKELAQIMREAELGRRVVDKLVKVWRLTGEEEWVLVHVEVQSQEETDFAERMYVYNYRLFDKYNRKVVSLAALGDERPGWRPDRFGYSLWGCTVGIQFPAVKLLDYADRLEMLETDANPFAAVVLVHLKTQETRRDPETRHQWKLRVFRGLYERGWTKAQIHKVFRFMDWMMDLPKELAKRFEQEVDTFEQGKHMPYVTSIERIGMCRVMLEAIELGLRLRFGEEGLQLLPEISQLDDVDILRVVQRTVLQPGTSLDEVRRAYAAPASEKH